MFFSSYNFIGLIGILIFLGMGCDAPEVNKPFALQVTDSTVVIYHRALPVLTYRITPQPPPEGADSVYTRSGFIHPLTSPKGATITDGFPKGHMHQHGIFYALTNTIFQSRHTDFWNQQNREGYVQHGQLLDTLVTMDSVIFSVRLDHLSTMAGKVGEEIWRIKFWTDDSLHILEIQSTWTNVTADTVYVQEYLYGGFAFRGAASWNIEDTIHFEDSMRIMTNEGLTRQQANHTHPQWMCAYGPVEGRQAGVLIFGAPDNFRSPQAVRVHPQMPYFVFAPMVDGAFTINPGASFKNKYRLIVFDDIPDEHAWYDKWKF